MNYWIIAIALMTRYIVVVCCRISANINLSDNDIMRVRRRGMCEWMLPCFVSLHRLFMIIFRFISKLVFHTPSDELTLREVRDVEEAPFGFVIRCN